MDQNALINHFRLEPHPEGGFYRRTYAASEKIAKAALPSRFGGDRAFSTAIYFLMPRGMYSRLHRLASDEVWHFYLGGPLRVVEIDESGEVHETVLGADVAKGQTFQHVVPAGRWFGSYPEEGTEFAFVGCTVSPGFDFEDFEMAEQSEMLRRFPGARRVIERLTL